MMHILFTTRVDQSLPTVWAGFTRSLFEQLSPPFPPVTVVRFDGCRQGDLVQLRLNFFLFHQDWTSRIIDQQTTQNEISFIDQGIRLPFFLTYWHHHHRLQRDAANRTIIIDDVTFRTPFRLTDYLLYPILWLQFAYRKPVYRRVFAR